MKKLLYTLILIIFPLMAFCEEFDYITTYKYLEPATFSYIHGIDPDQYYDSKTSAWSPYPLFRLNSNLYFKKTIIQPGYYLLTPRSNNGKWFILFKENGKVKYIIPAYKREIVPINFYKENLPQPKLTWSQKVHLKTIYTFGKIMPKAKRKEAPKSFLELTDLDNDFLSMVVYYGNFRYYLIFRTVAL